LSGTTFETNLHSLVDDEIDDRKRAETLAKLALSPADTEKLVNWRQQNQLLRAAFAGVEAETVPLSLSLVPASRTPSRPLAGENKYPIRLREGRRVLAALFCGAAAVGVFALALWPAHMPAAVDVMPVASIDTSRRQIGLSAETVALLNHANTTAASYEMTSSGKGHRINLPDLSRAGFALLNVSVYDDAIGPVACGIYVSGARKRVALCAEHEIGDSRNAPDPARTDMRVWRQGETLYSVASEGRETDLRDMSEQIRSVMMTAAKP
jgi:anti-sigma factor RsiW